MSRARKAGDAAVTERKLEQKYDEAESQGTPKAVVDWILQSLQGDVQAIAGYTWEDIQVYLKDGVILCMLINKILAKDGKQPISFQKKAKSAFIAMGNIEEFNKGCRNYGVPETALFQTADLYEGRKAQMGNVINCLNKLGFLANDKGFGVQYTPPAAPKLSDD